MGKLEERSGNQADGELLAEVRDVKRLLMLLLVKGGASQRELASALGVGQATISRLGIRSEKSLVIKVENAEEEN